jgi:hypothetical protein
MGLSAAESGRELAAIKVVAPTCFKNSRRVEGMRERSERHGKKQMTGPEIDFFP